MSSVSDMSENMVSKFGSRVSAACDAWMSSVSEMSENVSSSSSDCAVLGSVVCEESKAVAACDASKIIWTSMSSPSEMSENAVSLSKNAGDDCLVVGEGDSGLLRSMFGMAGDGCLVVGEDGSCLIRSMFEMAGDGEGSSSFICGWFGGVGERAGDIGGWSSIDGDRHRGSSEMDIMDLCVVRLASACSLRFCFHYARSRRRSARGSTE